jgi:hypothetical protein
MVEPGYQRRDDMSSKLNDATQLNDVELESVSGGGEAVSLVQTPAQKAAARAEAAFLASRTPELGPFIKPHEAFPHLG